MGAVAIEMGAGVCVLQLLGTLSSGGKVKESEPEMEVLIDIAELNGLWRVFRVNPGKG